MHYSSTFFHYVLFVLRRATLLPIAASTIPSCLLQRHSFSLSHFLPVTATFRFFLFHLLFQLRSFSMHTGLLVDRTA
jgi:hypothetical protein